MPRGSYDPVLAKRDPLETIHVKLPGSTIATLNHAASKLERTAVWIVRQQMMEWAKKWRENQADDDVLGWRGEDVSGKKRRRGQGR